MTAPNGASAALTKAATLPVRKLSDTRGVRKKVPLPGWLDALAREHNISFSKLLPSVIRKECDRCLKIRPPYDAQRVWGAQIKNGSLLFLTRPEE